MEGKIKFLIAVIDDSEYSFVGSAVLISNHRLQQVGNGVWKDVN